MSVIDILSGLRVPTQQALDAKLYFKTLADLIDLGDSNSNAFTYYEGMLVFCVESHTQYKWREEVVLNEVDGVINPTFTYPADSIVEGIDYSNRNFNFFPIDNLAVSDIYSENQVLKYSHDNIENTYQFDVSVFKFVFSIIYNQTITRTVTLDVADATFDRIDLIVLRNTNGVFTIEVVKGDADALFTPKELDNEIDIQITFVIVTKNTTAPVGVTNLTVYKEHLLEVGGEFDTQTDDGAWIDPDNTEQPKDGAKSIKFANAVNVKLNFIHSVSRIGSDITNLKFDIYLITAINYRFRITFWHLGVMQTAQVWISDGDFGFNANLLNQWQTIILSGGELNSNWGILQYDKVIFFNRRVGSTFYVDNITIQTGLPAPVNDTSITRTSQIINDGEDGINPFLSFIIIGTSEFLLFKDLTVNNDPNKRRTMEIGDAIIGRNSFGDLMISEYLGGTITDFRDSNVYATYGGFERE